MDCLTKRFRPPGREGTGREGKGGKRREGKGWEEKGWNIPQNWGN